MKCRSVGPGEVPGIKDTRIDARESPGEPQKGEMNKANSVVMIQVGLGDIIHNNDTYLGEHETVHNLASLADSRNPFLKPPSGSSYHFQIGP